jgi:hypothetical protein
MNVVPEVHALTAGFVKVLTHGGAEGPLRLTRWTRSVPTLVWSLRPARTGSKPRSRGSTGPRRDL